MTSKKNRLALKTLVVDDDPFQAELISDMLGELELGSVTVATSAMGALQVLAASSKSKAEFDLLVCDLQMPGLDGFQFMAAVAEGGFKGALIIVSGQSAQVLHSASLVAQLQRFALLGTLPKPVQKHALFELVSQIC